MKGSVLFKLISALVIGVILVSCAPAATPTAAPTTAPATVQPAAEQPTATTAPKPADTAVPAPTETAEPKVYKVVWYEGCPWYSDPLPDPSKDDVHQYILKNYGINLEIKFNSADCDDQKTAAMLAAGDFPDFTQQYWTNGTPLLNQLIDQGVILPIEREKYPGIQNAITPDAWKFLEKDGKAWGIAPPSDPTHLTLMVRQDWLDKLGLKAPTTPAEALEVMKAFTFKDPDGNGKNDTYGTTAFGGAAQQNSLMSWFAPFGFTFGQANLMVKDNQAYFPGLSDNAKQGLMWWNEVVKAKVIDPAWTTNTEDQFQEAIVNDKVGIITYYSYMLSTGHFPIADKLKAKNSPAKWVWIDPLTGPAGKYDAVQSIGNGIGNAFFVTKQAQSEPGKYEALMKFLNDAIDTKSDLYRMMVWGIKDVTYWTNDQGEVVKRQLDDAHKYMGHYRLFRTGNKEYRVGSWGVTNPLLVSAFTRADTLPVLWSVGGLVSPGDGSADLSTYVVEMQTKFATGEESFDNWDKFVKDAMSTYKGQALLDNYTKQLKALGLIK